MNHGLELVIPAWKHWKSKSPTFSRILEILETGFFQFLISWKYWNTCIFLISHILEILDRTIHTQSYPGNSGSYDPYISPILEILDRTIHISILSWK